MNRASIGRRSRQKGQEYERRICSELEEIMPGTEWKRRVQYRSAIVDGSDIEGSINGMRLPFWIEAHNGNQSVQEKLRQAEEDCQANIITLVIVHRPKTRYENDTVSMSILDFAELNGIIGVFSIMDDMIITINWNDFKSLLKKWWLKSDYPKAGK